MIHFAIDGKIGFYYKEHEILPPLPGGFIGVVSTILVVVSHKYTSIMLLKFFVDYLAKKYLSPVHLISYVCTMNSC